MQRAWWVVAVLSCWMWSVKGEEADLECLQQFKSRVVDERNALVGWRSASVCLWEGVGCERDRVTRLELSGAGLRGVMDSSLLQGCSSLSSLNLSANLFTGGVPADVCYNHPELTTLDLSHNSLSEPLPDFAACRRLQSLQLECNLLQGGVPPSLGLLPGLLRLNLSENRLSGAVPGALVNCSQGRPGFGADSFLGNRNLSRPENEPCSLQERASAGSRYKVVESVVVISVFACLIVMTVTVKVALWKLSEAASSRRVFACRSSKMEPVRVLSKKLPPLKVHHLLTATGNFSEEHVIGAGGCSTVYKAVLGDTAVAIKRLNVGQQQQQRLSQKTLDKTFSRELETFLRVRHRNLVKILGCVVEVRMKLLILEYMPNGSLEQQLYGCDLESASFECKLNWERRHKIAMGVALGLHYLHHDCPHPLVHGDLKPSNILLDADFEPHISDFGMTKLVTPPLQETQLGSDAHLGTIGYSAPEKAYSSTASPKEDVYSFGIVILELLTRQRPSSPLFGEGVTISEWVERGLLSHSSLPHNIVDPLLLQQQQQELAGIVLMLKVGVLCARQHPGARPDMRTVIKLLLRAKEAQESTKLASLDRLLQDMGGLAPVLASQHHPTDPSNLPGL